MEKLQPSFIARCYSCSAPRYAVESLKLCSGCKLVTYCSRLCQMEDRASHKYICKEFPVVKGNNALFTTGPWEEHIAGLQKRAAQLPHRDVIGENVFLNPRVCHTCHESLPERLTDCKKCACVVYCSTQCEKADAAHKKVCNDFFEQQNKFSVNNIMMSYPMSIRYALGFIPSHPTTITIHIISSAPMLDLFKWEQLIMHPDQMIIKLKLDFVIGKQDITYNPSANPSTKLTKSICNDCRAQKRSITYSFRKLPYHMFFSSEEYTEPNYVVIFGNTREMKFNADDAIHREMSYRNMLHSPQTLLILFDETKELVEKAYSEINALVPLHMLVNPKLNDFRNFSSMRAVLGYTHEVYNERAYYTVLQRKGQNPDWYLDHVRSITGERTHFLRFLN